MANHIGPVPYSAYSRIIIYKCSCDLIETLYTFHLPLNENTGIIWNNFYSPQKLLFIRTLPIYQNVGKKTSISELPLYYNYYQWVEFSIKEKQHPKEIKLTERLSSVSHVMTLMMDVVCINCHERVLILWKNKKDGKAKVVWENPIYFTLTSLFA